MNRASQIAPTLAGGAIARGAAFTIHGVHFEARAAVSVRKGNTTVSVRVLTVDPEKIEAILPESAPLGAAALVINVNGTESKPFPIIVAASNPGIFSQNGKGWGPGQIDNIDAANQRSLNSSTNPAHPGQRVVLRITGLGQGMSAMATVGNRGAPARLIRSIPQSGEQEISLTIPAEAPQGCSVPVSLAISANRSSNVVTMAIGAGGKCDPGPVPSLAANRIGIVAITRANMRHDGRDTITDEAIAVFSAKGRNPALSPLLLIPPPGTCTAYTSSFQASTIMPDSITASLTAEIGGDGLGAGKQFSVAREGDSRVVPWQRGTPGYYRARLGSSPLKSRAGRPPFLEPGEFVLSGAGGIDVGPLRVVGQSPAPFEWTNRDQTQIVERGRPLPLSWQGPEQDHFTVMLATNVDQITTAIGTCLCTAPLHATHFEVPAALLANIPASADMPGIQYAQLFVASVPLKATPVTARGLGVGAMLTIYANGRFVQYH